jgi:2-methylcitrate dehydratase PrpD
VDAPLARRDRSGGRAPQAVAAATRADTATSCDRPQPRTEGEARFTLQLAVAVVLAHGRTELADFAAPALDDPGPPALPARAAVATDPALTAAHSVQFGGGLTAPPGGGRPAEAAGQPAPAATSFALLSRLPFPPETP